MVKSKLSSFAHFDDEEPQTPVLTPSEITYDGKYIASSEKEATARDLIQKNVMYSLGIVLVPFPVIDLMYSAGIQINMIRELSDLYEIPFSKHAAKNVIYSLVAGIGSLTLGRMLAGSFFRLLPGGYLLSLIAANPIASGAVTYALGNVFVMHFEAGGTLLDFEPHEMKKYFYQSFQEGVEYSKFAKK